MNRFSSYFYLRSSLGSSSLIMAFNETKCSISLIPKFISPEENELNSTEIVERENRIRRLCWFGTYDRNNSEWLEFETNYIASFKSQLSKHDNGSIANVLNQSATHNISHKCLQNR